MWEGFCTKEEFPSPKSQLHSVGCSVEKSVSCISSPSHNSKEEGVNEATGGVPCGGSL